MKYHFTSLSTYRFLIFGLALLSYMSHANNGGVHGPMVKANSSQFDWRYTYVSSEEPGTSDIQASRLHYQQSLNERFQVRLVGQYRQQPDWEYDSAKIELLYNFNKFNEQDNYASAIRFDMRTRKGSRPDDIAVHWTNQLNLDAKNYIRAIVLFGKNLSGEQSKNWRIGTRFSYYRRPNANYQLGIELFDQYGEVSNIAAYDDQRHQLGPAVMAKFGALQLYARYLAGLTDSTPNHALSFRIGWNF
uniref:hypothetical protein n=1 Tax=Ningiella ruwaisensis TaxID=2364274 RepID=UPI00109F4504|nr:hypothetical protein [Ningiella ruwaisensis]